MDWLGTGGEEVLTVNSVAEGWLVVWYQVRGLWTGMTLVWIRWMVCEEPLVTKAAWLRVRLAMRIEYQNLWARYIVEAEFEWTECGLL